MAIRPGRSIQPGLTAVRSPIRASTPDVHWTCDWTTTPEVLEDKGVAGRSTARRIAERRASTRGVARTDVGPEHYDPDANPTVMSRGDNVLLYFKPYQDPSTRFTKRRLPDVPAEFWQRLQADQLPTVSWICRRSASTSSRAHPGPRHVVRQLSCDLLTSNPEVWSKTVRLSDVRRERRLFDHVSRRGRRRARPASG